MSTSTTNMGLTKPATTDTADITVINSNMDKLDAHRHAGGTDGLPIRAVQSGTLSARPSAGTPGAIYVATDTGQLFFDTGTAWQQAGSSGGSSMPVGAVTPWGGGTPPTGWLLCYGQAVSRTTYSALFTAIGTAFGTGDGSTTFNVPDLRGRVPLGADNMGGSSANRVTASQADNLGQGAGEEAHTLTTAEMPSHTHGQTQLASTAAGSWHLYPNTNGSTLTTGDNTAATGGGGAHSNMPPYLTLNYIIKT